QYAMSRIYAKQGKGDLADQARKAAFAAGAASKRWRYDTGVFLAEKEWDELAAAELQEFLKMPGLVLDDETGEVNDANAHFRLATIAIKKGDDFEAASQKQAAMQMLSGPSRATLRKFDGRGHEWAASEDEIWAEIHWRFIKAAVAKK